MEMQKAANGMAMLSGVSTALQNPSFAGGLTGVIGHGAKALGGLFKGTRTSGIRHGIGQKLENFGSGAQKLGDYTSDVAHGILNAGPGIEYDASKLPGLLGFESRTGGKKTKLTAQRGLWWAGNAATAGTAAGQLNKALRSPEPQKQAREDAVALIAFWENSI